MQTTLTITMTIIAILASLYFIARARMKNIPVVADSDRILTLTDKNFQHQTKNKLVLVDFWASGAKQSFDIHNEPFALPSSFQH